MPDAELTEAARAELADFAERKRRVRATASRRNGGATEARRTRFRVEHLREVIAGPPGQDPAGPVVTYVAVYDDGLLVDFLHAGAARAGGASRAEPQRLPTEPSRARSAIDDGQGTEFRVRRAAASTATRRSCAAGWQYGRAPAAEASRLRVAIDSTVIEIALAVTMRPIRTTPTRVAGRAEAGRAASSSTGPPCA